MNPLNPLISVSRKFYGYLKKDLLLLYKRKKYLYLFLALPFIIGLLFIFFLDPTPGNISAAVCDHDSTQYSRQAVSDLAGFNIVFLSGENCSENLINAIKSKKFALGLEIPKGFSNNLLNMKQSRIVAHYDNTDIAFSNLMSWKVDSVLQPFERSVIDKLNNEIKIKIVDNGSS